MKKLRKLIGTKAPFLSSSNTSEPLSPLDNHCCCCYAHGLFSLQKRTLATALNRNQSLEFWRHRVVHQQFFDKLARELGYTQMEDWYKLTDVVIRKHGGSGILTRFYGGSYSKALQAV